MISLPKLDDQNYAEIVEAAKRRIPVIFPEWTDFNEHDPGITVIELFAWLKEMQQYTLDRIPDSTREAMLRLAGVQPLEAAPAAVELIPAAPPEFLPAGSTAHSADGTEFTLTEPFRRQDAQISKIYMKSPGGYVDVTGLSGERGAVFYPFGAELDCAGRYLLIKLTAAQEEISLDFITSERCAVARNPYADEYGTPRDIRWEYSTSAGFAPCEVRRDLTHGMSFSGRLTLGCGDIGEYSEGLPEKGVWLRACIEYAGCEDMPLLSGIYTNALALTQKTRGCVCTETRLDGGFAEADDVLAARGEHVVMLRDEHGWYDVPEPEFTVEGSRVRFGLSQYAAVDDGAVNVRIISYSKEFSGKMCFSSDGLPCQEFPFDPDGTVLTGELRIMVRDRADSEFPRWNEYTFTEDLALGGEFDRAFSFDEKRRRIVFGDNENGEAPPVGTDNILVISCSLTKGAAGNLAAGNLHEITGAEVSCAVEQPLSCCGGRFRETTSAALRRFRAELSDCQRAVSAEDFRKAALRTPGLRVADVRAIPFFDPGDPYAPAERLCNTVTLAVLPYSRGEFPEPDERFLAAVRAHMERCRLLTVELKTSAPAYVRVNISAELACGSGEVGRVIENAEKKLHEMFSVYGADGRSRFGEPIRESAVIAGLCSVDGVLAVKRLRMNIDRPDCKKTSAGISIPPHAIACCGKVELISSGN